MHLCLNLLTEFKIPEKEESVILAVEPSSNSIKAA